MLLSTKNNNYEQLSLQILDNGFWLTDEHVDHGQWLLSKKFPEGKGLHSVLVFEGEKSKVKKGLKDFVQVINVGTEHWVTVSNIGCEENAVKVYDSLFMDQNKKRQKFHSSLASLLDTSLPNMIIHYPRMQKQEGCDDCGVFALAVAFTLLAGDDPSQLIYDQSCMRGHLALCFQCNELAPFPVKSPGCEQLQEQMTRTVDLFCHCRKPDSGTFMIECSACCGWFHRSCENVPRKLTKKTLFYCANLGIKFFFWDQWSHGLILFPSLVISCYIF